MTTTRNEEGGITEAQLVALQEVVARIRTRERVLEQRAAAIARRDAANEDWATRDPARHTAQEAE